MANKTKANEKSQDLVSQLGLGSQHRPMTEEERRTAQRRTARKLDLAFGCVHPALKH